jgi:hypothetical protein
VSDKTATTVSTAADIAAIGSYGPVNTTDGVVPEASYKWGPAVVIDTGVTTGKQYLYRLVVERDGVKSDAIYELLKEGPFLATTEAIPNEDNASGAGVINPADANGYQKANTVRLALSDLDTTSSSSLKVEIWRRKSDEPATAFTKLNTAGTAFEITSSTDLSSTLYWIDTDVDYKQKYVYKLVVLSSDGTVFENIEASAGGVTPELIPTLATVATPTGAAITSGTHAPTSGIRIQVNAGDYVEGMKLKYRTKENSIGTCSGAWKDATVIRAVDVADSGSTPTTYIYYFNVTGVTSGTTYDVQYYTDRPGATIPDPTDTPNFSNVTAN